MGGTPEGRQSVQSAVVFLNFSSTLSWFCLNRKALGWGSFLVLAPFYCALARDFGEVEASDKCLAGVSKNGWTDGAGAGISSATARLAIAELQWL